MAIVLAAGATAWGQPVGDPASGTVVAPGQMQYRGATPLDREKLFADVKAKPGARVTEETGLWRVDVPSEYAIYFFTREGHFAHPSVVIRKIVEKQGNMHIETQGFTAGDRQVFEAWLRKFQEQDKPSMDRARERWQQQKR